MIIHNHTTASRSVPRLRATAHLLALVGVAASLSAVLATSARALERHQATTPLTATITLATIHPAKKTATFEFSASGGNPDGAVAFRCNLERHGYVVGPFRSCTSPKHYGSLPAGTYTFYVYAIDTTGTKSNTASHDFTIR